MQLVRSGAVVFVVLSTVALAACGGGGTGQAQNNADQMRRSAAQSTPEAAAVLENEADMVEGGDTQLPPNAPNSPAQNAMSKAGNVQAGQN